MKKPTGKGDPYKLGREQPKALDIRSSMTFYVKPTIFRIVEATRIDPNQVPSW